MPEPDPQTCVYHDLPIVADIVDAETCEILAPACSNCIGNMEHWRAMGRKHKRTKAVQYRILIETEKESA